AVSVISNISMEHRMYLGNTLAEIASEKGGIIKKGVPVVTGVRQRAVISTLEEIALERDAPLHRLGPSFRVRKEGKNAFNYYGMDNAWRHLSTGLTGRHQIENASLALAACEILNRRGMGLTPETIQTGLGRTRWPGRLEVVSESPLILLDGAHNLAAAKNLARHLAEELADREITLVVGILDDKQYKGMLESILPLCKKCIVTRPVIDRALPPEKIRRVADRIIDDVRVIDRVSDAVEYAAARAKPEDVICIAGSLYVVGEAMEALQKK
ncbi:MAG: bifunctional folylpolyglutamate synthase/dihydrofolate synthase, partial [Desulfobacterales bacterium]|nr:bifunctional folylpolyglutamate synthase/dihydrofolate synthase [Desulfobacterales bacterium]